MTDAADMTDAATLISCRWSETAQRSGQRNAAPTNGPDIEYLLSGVISPRFIGVPRRLLLPRSEYVSNFFDLSALACAACCRTIGRFTPATAGAKAL